MIEREDHVEVARSALVCRLRELGCWDTPLKNCQVSAVRIAVGAALDAVHLNDLLDIMGAAFAFRLAETDELRKQSLAALDAHIKLLDEKLGKANPES